MSYDYESKSRGYDLSDAKRARTERELAVFCERWRAIVDADLYYDAHFERQAGPSQRLTAYLNHYLLPRRWTW